LTRMRCISWVSLFLFLYGVFSRVSLVREWVQGIRNLIFDSVTPNIPLNVPLPLGIMGL